jgi:hypothetical protein
MTSAAPGRRGIATVNGRPMECVILGNLGSPSLGRDGCECGRRVHCSRKRATRKASDKC